VVFIPVGHDAQVKLYSLVDSKNINTIFDLYLQTCLKTYLKTILKNYTLLSYDVQKTNLKACLFLEMVGLSANNIRALTV